MHTLEKISHVVFVVVAVLLAGLSLWRVNGADDKFVPEARETQREIQRSVLAELGVAEAPTVLITVSSNCRFCTASMDFYRRLTTAARSAGARVMFASREPVDVIRHYVLEHGLATPTVVALPTALDVAATPSLMWVSPSQAKVSEWIGQLSAQQEEAVLAVVTSRN